MQANFIATSSSTAQFVPSAWMRSTVLRADSAKYVCTGTPSRVFRCVKVSEGNLEPCIQESESDNRVRKKARL